MLVALSLLSLTVLAVFSLLLSRTHESEHNQILNALGRQRMLTQQIAKDANRISSLLDAIESPVRLQEVNYLESKLWDVRISLSLAIEAFGKTLASTEGGVLQIDEGGKIRSISLFDLADPSFAVAVGETRKLWTSFESSARLIASSGSKDARFRAALIVINEGNLELLAHTERISRAALDAFGAKSRFDQTAFAILTVSLIFLVVWLLYGTYRFLIEPYTLFYRGVKTMGAAAAEASPSPGGRYSVLTREVADTFAMMRDMLNLVAYINQGNSFSETLSLIFRTFKPYVPYEYIGVATFAGYRGTRLTAAYGESDGSFATLPARLMGKTWDIGTTSLGEILETGFPRVINDLEIYSRNKPPKEYTQILLEEGIRSSITLPLVMNGKALGFLFFSSRTVNAYTDLHLSFLQNLRNAVALAFEKNIVVDELVYATTLSLAKMAEARDEDTADHLDRMSRYTTLLARLMIEQGVRSSDIPGDFVKDLERFSPMHDIGKVGIRDDVLLKPGKLDPAEWEHMKTHTTYGANVLKEAANSNSRVGRSFFTMGIRIAQNHHEKWDGSGYPEGLSGEAIPLEARIIAVADVLDALTTKRPYKKAFPFEESVAIMREGAGTHFDPEIFACFERNLGAFRALHGEFERGGNQ